MKQLANAKDIKQVLDGLQQFYNRMIQTQQFNAVEMKNFMEPIFEQADYRRQLPAGSSPNIIVFNDGGVGDFVINSAAIRELRRVYPNAHITFVFFARAQALAEVCPYVNEIIANAQRFAFNNFLSVWQWNFNFAQRLLRRRYDMAYAFASQGSTILLSYMSGAKVRISRKFSEGEYSVGAPVDLPLHLAAPLLTVETPRNSFGETHEVNDHLGLLDYTLHARIANREIEVWFSPQDRAKAENLICADERRTYALCMGGSAPRKQWQPENYAGLIEKIVER